MFSFQSTYSWSEAFIIQEVVATIPFLKGVKELCDIFHCRQEFMRSKLEKISKKAARKKNFECFSFLLNEKEKEN